MSLRDREVACSTSDRQGAGFSNPVSGQWWIQRGGGAPPARALVLRVPKTTHIFGRNMLYNTLFETLVQRLQSNVYLVYILYRSLSLLSRWQGNKKTR